MKSFHCAVYFRSTEYVSGEAPLKLSTNMTEAAVHRCYSKEVILKISQISQENKCVGASF